MLTEGRLTLTYTRQNLLSLTLDLTQAKSDLDNFGKSRSQRQEQRKDIACVQSQYRFQNGRNPQDKIDGQT
jgi:hypothetical protein